ncbi:MAG: TonB-dependent receptor plug domain-containing protein [Muribaculaceae bacterium]|nr:TonB-dependent receptor plug domain-containing protein [Muribaculaceae bacterium]
MSVVGGSQLELQSPVNIIGALARQPGVAQISTGSGISKPVIRGLGFNRVLVVNDGVRQEGQQWGDEHGVEIDGNSVSSAEIIKGPASLMYGSDALAGVIVFNDAPTMRNGGSPRSYATALPYQMVGHYKIVSDNMIYLGSGMLTAIVGYQQNRRREFEEHDHSHAHAEATDVASPQYGDASGGPKRSMSEWKDSLRRVGSL